MPIDAFEILGKVALFEGLDEEQRRRVASVLRERRFEAGEVLMREGDAGNTLCVLCEGTVEITRTLTLRGAGGDFVGGEKSFNVLSADVLPVLGEIAVVDQNATRSATVRAREPGVLLEMQKKDFDRLIAEDPGLGCIILRHISENVCSLLRKSNTDVLKLTTALSIALGR